MDRRRILNRTARRMSLRSTVIDTLSNWNNIRHLRPDENTNYSVSHDCTEYLCIRVPRFFFRYEIMRQKKWVEIQIPCKKKKKKTLAVWYELFDCRTENSRFEPANDILLIVMTKIEFEYIGNIGVRWTISKVW